jgi:hypothetical protein
MTFGDYIILTTVVLYAVAGIAYIVQGRVAFGAAWICYACANVCFLMIGST